MSAAETGTRTPPVRAPRLLSGSRRLPTVGLLLVTTLIAFEALAVATVMPTTARALHGLGLYSFGFTGFLAASILGMVDAGARTDRRGPTGVMLAGLTAFAAGLLTSGLAPSMPVFIAGRAASGFGAGSVIVAVYVLIARVYDPQLRPRVFAAMSAAWVLPALIGPTVAGAVTEGLGWRWVYLGLPPLIAVGFGLLMPALRHVPAGDAPPASRTAATGAAVLLAAAVGMVQLVGSRVTPARLVLAAAGLALLGLPLRRLLPAGTLTLRRGLPTAIACRGLLAAAFFAAEAFVPLTLTTAHGARPTVAGLPLTFGAIGWSLGSTYQGRAADRDRPRLLRIGFVLLALGVAGVSAVSLPGVPALAALPPWLLAGAGMGLATPALSIVVLAASPEAEQGGNAAALQIADAVGSATAIAVAGAIVAAATGLGHTLPGFAVVDLAMAAVAVGGAVVAHRVAG